MLGNVLRASSCPVHCSPFCVPVFIIGYWKNTVKKDTKSLSKHTIHNVFTSDRISSVSSTRLTTGHNGFYNLDRTGNASHAGSIQFFRVEVQIGCAASS